MKEQWKDIKGYESHYQVSNLGNVKSVCRLIKNSRYGNGVIKERYLKPAINCHGYVFVSLCLNGVSKSFRIHRLVAVAFIENSENKEQVNHINGIKSDNRLDNLEWSTRSENVLHSYQKLNRIAYQTGRFGKNSPSAVRVVQYDLNGNLVNKFDSQIEAAIATGIGKHNINKCFKNKSKTAGGFMWKSC
jgi:hypothetical protein